VLAKKPSRGSADDGKKSSKICEKCHENRVYARVRDKATNTRIFVCKQCMKAVQNPGLLVGRKQSTGKSKSTPEPEPELLPDGKPPTGILARRHGRASLSSDCGDVVQQLSAQRSELTAALTREEKLLNGLAALVGNVVGCCCVCLFQLIFVLIGF
jgi:hypothetical protein